MKQKGSPSLCHFAAVLCSESVTFQFTKLRPSFVRGTGAGQMGRFGHQNGKCSLQQCHSSLQRRFCACFYRYALSSLDSELKTAHLNQFFPSGLTPIYSHLTASFICPPQALLDWKAVKILSIRSRTAHDPGQSVASRPFGSNARALPIVTCTRV
jgi:hypothetical protein